MDDLISRQAAINAFDDAGFCTHGYIVDVLEELPSAQPHWTPCDLCKYNPPSSMDGKPCTICPAVGRGESE